MQLLQQDNLKLNITWINKKIWQYTKKI
jgi:hypothetical protein